MDCKSIGCWFKSGPPDQITPQVLCAWGVFSFLRDGCVQGNVQGAAHSRGETLTPWGGLDGLSLALWQLELRASLRSIGAALACVVQH